MTSLYASEIKCWHFVAPEDIPRAFDQVLVKPWFHDALLHLTPEIATQPDRADTVFHRLKALLMSVQGDGLVRCNELFAQWLRGEKSMPFGENNEHTPVRLIDFENLSNNDYVVTNQCIYPTKEGGHRMDVVLLVNGIPLVIGEAKTSVRPAVTGMYGTSDIHNGYKKTVPQLFVPSVFSFATEGKCFRYGSVRMPLEFLGPWHNPANKSEGTLLDVQRSARSILQPHIILDTLQNFTLFGTDKKHRYIKIIARYQQYGAQISSSSVSWPAGPKRSDLAFLGVR
ncbi:type I restriction endonuclease [uncultured Bilophila sp.]|uniref:type I restriction endonuclease n=1 Tax=uncultured Bilophila sp. TaxID=529385 RepID=UPI00266EB22C|nr:type I restriction endonuclease [uncultured Bilophila sp.]